MSHRNIEQFLEQEELTDWINNQSIALVKSITRDNKEHEATIVMYDITDLTTLDDYKSYINWIIMLINDMGALGTYYDTTTNSITVWYD